MTSRKEHNWINLIRKEYAQPLQYSSLDRSLIVYMALLNVRFGDRQNYIGLERLIKRKVVIDAYALHDGPYYIPQDSTSINARQILFYNWVGITNIFTRQPLNVVHEYFGPKVALYFAYYGLYNLFLTIASIAALMTLFLAVFLNETYMNLRSPICYPTAPQIICFSCFNKTPTFVMCYVIKLFRFCNWYTINILVDNKYTTFFATFIILWGMFFTAYWFGREKYLNWIWETRNKDFNRKQIRPEYDFNQETARKSNKTGIVIAKNRDFKIKILICYIVVILLAVFIFAIFLRLRKLQDKAYIKSMLMLNRSPEKIIPRLIYTMIGFSIVLSIVDFIHRKVASYIVQMENHKTYVSYSRSLAKHLYMLCLPLPMIVLGYYGFHSAIFDMWRGYEKDNRYLLDDMCVMTSCLFELSFAFLIVLLLRYVILRKLSLYSSVTDYNQRAIVENVPCWEREFVLPRFNENILASKMTILVMQLTLIMSFGFACPPAIVIVLVFNIYDMRRDAELCTLHYRRPLLLKNNSFDVWTEILKLMVYIAIVVNVVSFVCSTDTIETFLREQRKSTGNTLKQFFQQFFFEYTIGMVTCYARAYTHKAMDTDIGKEELTVDELRTCQYMYIYFFEIIMAAIYLIMQYIFSIDVDEKKIPKKQGRGNNDE
ncbi:PREDICTED: anoctamin-9-like isoform X2 [Papilio xuthus]|nr:PREDICTED: anoctamin-9-like isoform X2 [Papilio xuthus]